MRRRIDPEDVVHSAYRSFFLRAAEGDFELHESGDLWRLLAQITLNKVRKQAERQTAQRRDVSREEVLDAALPSAAPHATPEEVAILVEQVRLIVERLSGDERQALTAMLAGASVDEIAGKLAKSPRTIRRVMGTLGYLAPELFDPGAVPTAASDVYSLGKLLEQTVSGVADSLRALWEQCLAPDPASRPQTAEEFLMRLRQGMANQSKQE